MIKKVRAKHKRKCKMCGHKIDAGQCCFDIIGSGFYSVTICMSCVVKETRKEV